MVGHAILLRKLELYRFDTQALLWYLDHRRQFDTFKGQCSDLRLVSTGVPQGSMLCPVPFINDVHLKTNA